MRRAVILLAQRAKWEAAAVNTYQFTLTWKSMVGGGDFAVSVVNGRPSRVRPADPSRSGARADEERAAARSVPSSIDELFDVLQRVAEAEQFEVTYDPQYGFPTAARIDDELAASDDEFEFQVSNFRAECAQPCR